MDDLTRKQARSMMFYIFVTPPDQKLDK